MKTIGFVCEGPRDSDLLEAVIRHILKDDITALYLQPEPTMSGENGNGWKGVWSWCHKNGNTLDQYMQGATPKIDAIIIQIDGDVSRKEQEAHCSCYTGVCKKSGTIFPLNCTMDNCPIVLPCRQHAVGVTEYVSHLQSLILQHFPGRHLPICVIPCDSSDTWIVAACDEYDYPETIEDPWTNVISKKKEYYGVRVPGHKKTKAVYEKFIPIVCQNWNTVKNRCTQASHFDSIISAL